MSVMDDAQILWDYHQMHHEPRNTDIAIGLGRHDIGVAEHTADLYHQGRFPLIVFTGANAPTTTGLFPRGEAVHFAERATQLDVPSEAILLERRAGNTQENFTLTRDLLRSRGLHVQSATLISRPYQQRRAYATCIKNWPNLEAVCSSRQEDFVSYLDKIKDTERILNMLVGDTQRIWLYAQRGYAAEQALPHHVRSAYLRLVDAGYDSRVTASAPPPSG